jgi:hypothetical protein
VLLAGLRSYDSLLVVRPWLARGLAATARAQWRAAAIELARISPGQVFPSPGRDVLLKRLNGEATNHQFQVVSVKMFRPRQFAPMVVVRTTDYVSLAGAAYSILARLDPDYEGFYLEAQDEFGVPFLAIHILGRFVRAPENYPSWGMFFARSDPLEQALERGVLPASRAVPGTRVVPDIAVAPTGASNAPKASH